MWICCLHSEFMREVSFSLCFPRNVALHTNTCLKIIHSLFIHSFVSTKPDSQSLLKMQLGTEEQLDVFSDWMLWTLAACLILSIGIVLGIVIEKLSVRPQAKELLTQIPPQVETNTNYTTKQFATSIHNLPVANPVIQDPSKVWKNGRVKVQIVL